METATTQDIAVVEAAINVTLAQARTSMAADLSDLASALEVVRRLLANGQRVGHQIGHLQRYAASAERFAEEIETLEGVIGTLRGNYPNRYWRYRTGPALD